MVKGLIRVREFGHCNDCTAQLTTFRLAHSKLERVGLDVHDAGSSTVLAYYQCQTCGSLWEHLQDFDPGERGSYLYPMRRYNARSGR